MGDEKSIETLIEELKSGQRALNNRMVDLRDNDLAHLADQIATLGEKVDGFVNTSEYTYQRIIEVQREQLKMVKSLKRYKIYMGS